MKCRLKGRMKCCMKDSKIKAPIAYATGAFILQVYYQMDINKPSHLIPLFR